jgi:hypothetical protein
MREVMERWCSLYPREQYVMNLAALHGQLGDSEKQLALMEIAAATTSASAAGAPAHDREPVPR